MEKTFVTALVLMAGVAFSSCSSCDEPVYSTDRLRFNFTEADFKSTNGEWIHAYDAAYDNSLNYGGLNFSRKASADEWGGVVYYSWKGFTPSMTFDSHDYPGQWVEYQWGTIAGRPANNGFMLACWDSQEELGKIPSQPSVAIKAEKGTFKPVSVTIANAAYSYYVMKYGDSFCKKFEAGDSFKLYILGVYQGVKTGEVVYELAAGTDISKQWSTVQIGALGEVDSLVFQMSSTDSGQWGMNTPGYFALGALDYNK